ncbi:MAG TPA: resolvase [Firmicutes bacterium]|jgi:RNase H-fold protein (predicted Holliday junction resolvase)|nr:resolvase [Bacillota bacterium]
MTLLAIDPGKIKFGYAILTQEKKVLTQGIAEVASMLEVVEKLISQYHVGTVVIGDRTGSRDFCVLLQRAHLPKGLKVETIDEDASSNEGRQRFLLANRRGWRKYFPLGLQSPSRPYDDYVAVILGERYLNSSYR